MHEKWGHLDFNGLKMMQKSNAIDFFSNLVDQLANLPMLKAGRYKTVPRIKKTTKHFMSEPLRSNYPQSFFTHDNSSVATVLNLQRLFSNS